MAPPAQRQTGFAQLSTGVKLVLLLMMLGVMAAIYYFALHMSLAEDIEQAEQRQTQLGAQLEEANRRQQEFLELSQELAAREPIDRQNKRVLPDQAEIAAFLQDLNRLAELSGLSILLVEPRPEEPAELYVRIPVTLRLSGQYHQLAKFFFNVSKLDRAVNMENVHMREPQAEGDQVLLEIGVLATTFRSPEAPAEGAATGAAGQAAAPRGGTQ